jgi:hypothetical protein
VEANSSTFFKELDITTFSGVFSDEEQCLSFIASEKWKEGFVCRKCGNTNYCEGKKLFSRRCTRCKHEESATAHTIFHGCHLPITEAFQIAYTVCGDPGISTYELSRRLERRQMTCWKLKKKIMECIERKGRLELTTDD